MAWGWDLLKFLLLVSVLPLQLYLTSTTAPTDVTAAGQQGRTLDGGHGYYRTGLQYIERARAWAADVYERGLEGRRRRSSSPSPAPSPPPSPAGVRPDQTPADEVRHFNYFGNSQQPRLERPPKLKFRVGQVVRHRRYGYRGVIVGWDAEALAPHSWFDQMGVAPADRKRPFYAVLVDERDRGPPAQRTYVLEDNLEVLQDDALARTIRHPNMGDFFTGRYHVGMKRYEMREHLRRRYPKD